MREETQALFKALFALEDIRELLRKTAPEHKFSQKEKEIFAESIKKIREQLNVMERCLGEA